MIHVTFHQKPNLLEKFYLAKWNLRTYGQHPVLEINYCPICLLLSEKKTNKKEEKKSAKKLVLAAAYIYCVISFVLEQGI